MKCPICEKELDSIDKDSTSLKCRNKECALVHLKLPDLEGEE